jgi:hypothetical protein
MSLSSQAANRALEQLASNRIQNLIAQTDARRILQEVKESAENFPQFDPKLTDKATHIAFTMISCGCSLVENEEGDNDALFALERAGKLLSDAYQFNAEEVEESDLNLLVAGMSLYAAKQYSRAFITLKDVSVDFAVGQIIICFIKKDFRQLSNLINEVFFASTPDQIDTIQFDEWIIQHEITRCFFITTNYIRTGDSDTFNAVFGILDILLSLAEMDCLTLYWLLIRLLKIIFLTFQESSLWNVLPPLVPRNDTLNKYVNLLGHFKSPVIEMWPSQASALSIALGDNIGGVINLRTSGGKTRVAETAILKTLITDPDAKVLYLAPFRSLAFEIEQSLNKVFLPLGFVVSQLYGGATTNASDLELIRASQIIIATPEKAKALIRHGSGIEGEIKLIVIDEGHLLGEENRYIRNEVFFTHIRKYASIHNIRILLLSAVLPNAGELAQWITGDMALVAKSDWKPSLERLGLLLWDGHRVRLEWKSDGSPFNPNFVQQKALGFSRRRKPFPNDKNEAISATAVRLARTGTVMIYVAQARSVKGFAEKVLLALGENPPDFAWNPSLWDIFYALCEEELGTDHIVLKAAKKGVICHSNKLPTLVRIAIERLMRSKPPVIIIATSTLGQGVNVGISTVIVASPYYDNEARINNRDFWNICGRAGRAFSDTEGKILYAIDTKITSKRKDWQIRNDRKLAEQYLNSNNMEKAASGLLVALKAIFIRSQKAEIDFEILLEAIANDFSEDTINSKFAKWLKCVFDFIDDELLAMHQDFSSDGLEVEWIDDVFRYSLAFIQAESHKEEYSRILKARALAVTTRFANVTDVKKIVASGVPFSVARSIMENIDAFRAFAQEYMEGLWLELESPLDLLDAIVRKLEIWINKNASSCFEQEIPDQTVLDTVRKYWLKGEALSSISAKIENADKVAKDYYGFTIPWVIHAISQMFDPDAESHIVKLYSNLAMFVELGLPDETSANIYMAGVRSRTASLELSQLSDLQKKTVIQIKRTLINLSEQEPNLPVTSKVWLDLLSETFHERKEIEVSFPAFTWKQEGLPDRLYLHKNGERVFLSSDDGYFYKEIADTENLPFSQIAGIDGLYFERDKELWRVKSFNPHISIHRL